MMETTINRTEYGLLSDQRHFIVLNGVPVANSSKGGAQATLKNVGVNFHLVTGDTTGDGTVNRATSRRQNQSPVPLYRVRTSGMM